MAFTEKQSLLEAYKHKLADPRRYRHCFKQVQFQSMHARVSYQRNEEKMQMDRHGSTQDLVYVIAVVCYKFFGLRPVLVRPDQRVLLVLVLGQKSAARFFPTHPVLVRPGLAVAVTGYPQVIRMRAHWIAILSTGRAYDK